MKTSTETILKQPLSRKSYYNSENTEKTTDFLLDWKKLSYIEFSSSIDGKISETSFWQKINSLNDCNKFWYISYLNINDQIIQDTETMDEIFAAHFANTFSNKNCSTKLLLKIKSEVEKFNSLVTYNELSINLPLVRTIYNHRQKNSSYISTIQFSLYIFFQTYGNWLLSFPFLN